MTQYTNNANLPEPVVLALTHDDYSRGASNRSVTQLIDSPRAQILRALYDDQVVEDVSDLIWLALGKAMHLLFEKYAQGKWKPEERLFAEQGGWTISGAIDIQHNDGGVITAMDYKTASVWSVIFGKEDWHSQLNFYAWLIRQAKGIEVNQLQILVILKDWKKSELKQKGNDYPPYPIMLIDIPLWSHQRQDDYVAERVKIHQDAEFLRLVGDTLPLCTDKERWKNPAKYAVIKKGNKRAKRVLDSQEQAEEYIQKECTEYAVVKDGQKRAVKVFDTEQKAGGYITVKALENHSIDKRSGNWIIEERPSVPKRCADEWCKIAQWCDQYQRELQEQAGELKLNVTG